MYNEEFNNVGYAGTKKLAFLNNNLLGYLISAMLGGAFIGFGTLLVYTIGGYLDGSVWTKTVMGIGFGVGLCLVIFAGAELFTSNTFVMTTSALLKKITWIDVIKLCVVCYIFNWVGSFVLSFLFTQSGLASGHTLEFIAHSAEVKVSLLPKELIIRGILCNILVCLSIWCTYKLKSETAKIIMMAWCLFAFVTAGYEHSMANMTLLSVALLNNAIDISGYAYNILVVGFGNLIGGAFFVAVPYYLISKKDKVQN